LFTRNLRQPALCIQFNNKIPNAKTDRKDTLMKEDCTVFIFGPTAVGKTTLACEAAKGIGEIVSVDSMQIYRGLECGTAKPSEEQLRAVQHHLVSTIPPEQRFSAGDFRKMAVRLIREITGRQKVPVFVGGTGLYFRALEYDFIDAPKAQPALREALYDKEESDSGCLYRELMNIDPDTARSVHQNDLLRIVRALEIYYTAGSRFSELTGSYRERQRRYCPLKIGISIDRETLFSRIESRCARMIECGLGREVYGLLKKGLTEKLPSMKGLGYSHFIQYFKGCFSLEETFRLFVRDTKRYAKRQLTWFRGELNTEWFDPNDVSVIREKIIEFAGI
jgi:tRNA dimethylallyltransferase